VTDPPILENHFDRLKEKLVLIAMKRVPAIPPTDDFLSKL
jgi:hypothetical protein